MSNGGKIEIIKPFGEAFELMQKILFKPFDMKKWLVIGFAAFLAGHLNGVNLPIGNLGGSHPANQNIPSPDFEQWKPWLPIIIVAFVVLLLTLAVVLTWLKARGNFIFTDCIARNRAAIAVPWREYCREGNSYFLFLLLVGFGAMSIFGVLAFCMFSLGLLGHNASDSTMTPVLIILLILFSILFIFLGFSSA